VFEIKWDGFRALLYSDSEGMRLVSRNGNTFKSFPGLCDGLARDLNGRRCVLDGEIVCLDSGGKPRFRNLLFRRAEPVSAGYAADPRKPKGTGSYSHSDALARIEEPLIGVHSD